MEKQEFLDKLRLALSGKVAPEIVSDTMNYYEEYINGEVRMGKSAEEVMAALGDPRLIARTIVETRSRQTTEGAGAGEQGGSEIQPVFRHIPGWVWLVILLVVVILVLSIVFKILAVFFPFIVMLGLVIFLVKLFRDWIN